MVTRQGLQPPRRTSLATRQPPIVTAMGTPLALRLLQQISLVTRQLRIVTAMVILQERRGLIRTSLEIRTLLIRIPMDTQQGLLPLRRTSLEQRLPRIVTATARQLVRQLPLQTFLAPETHSSGAITATRRFGLGERRVYVSRKQVTFDM